MLGGAPGLASPLPIWPGNDAYERLPGTRSMTGGYIGSGVLVSEIRRLRIVE